MITALRDPRICPVNGDVLSLGAATFKVYLYVIGEVQYWQEGDERARYTSIESWRAMMKDAIVLKHGGKPKPTTPPEDFKL